MELALELPEIVRLICQHVYSDTLDYPLDPPVLLGAAPSLALRTLHALSRVNHLFHREALPFLYRDVQVSLPATFEGLVGTVGVLKDEQVPISQGNGEGEHAGGHNDDAAGRPGRDSTSITITGDLPRLEPSTSMLSPLSSAPTSRDNSRGRGPNPASSAHARGLSPQANFFMSVSTNEAASSRPFAMQYARPFRADNSGLFTKSLTFERFRSHGLKRTVREASQQRFVTPERLLQVLRGTRGHGAMTVSEQGEVLDGSHTPPVPTRQDDRDPDDPHGNLEAIALTEYIDSALTIDVLEELLLRGGTSTRDHPDQLIGTALAFQTKPIMAIDFCGCVSRTFVEALGVLISRYNLNGHDSTRPVTIFPHLRRLGLFNVLISTTLLTPLVNAFPHLTHLDLANTRASPALLKLLSESRTLRLQSLSLSKCQMLTSECLLSFLTTSEPNVLQEMIELNLHYDATSAMPLSKAHLKVILEQSPVFQLGKLRFLDISTAPLDDMLLSDSFPEQPHLIDFGMSNCPSITWKGLATLLQHRVPAVEILDVKNSCRQQQLIVSPAGRTARRNDALLNTIMGVHQCLIPPAGKETQSRLRVLELDEKALEALDDSGAAHPDWKVFWGTRYRGWYVNCGVAVRAADSDASNISAENQLLPEAEGYDGLPKRVWRRLAKDEPDRQRLLFWAKKSKHQGQNFGWHARKMSIIRPDGMLGREYGLYHYHSFS